MNPFQNIFPTAIIPEGLMNHTDHLGNIRVSYTKNPQTGALEIMEENHYYPEACPERSRRRLKHEVYSSANLKGFIADKEIEGRTKLVTLREDEFKYKYNGKEWQDELSLNMYAMDMRMFDPAIARWVVQDPIVHFNQSPYSSFDGNPVYWADPSGAAGEHYNWEEERYENDRGAEVTFEEAMASHGLNPDGTRASESADENDDIRFRDKNGTLIATYYTNEVDTDVNIPFEIVPKRGNGEVPIFEPNINLNWLLIVADINLIDLDVIGIGGDWDFTAVMGGGRYVEAIYFLDGLNAKTWHFYEGNRMNVGLNGGAGIYGIFGDYYNDKTLTKNDYAGISFSVGVGLAKRPIGSAKFWATKPGIKDNSGFKSFFNKKLRSWTGYTVGVGVGAGIQWSKQETRLLN